MWLSKHGNPSITYENFQKRRCFKCDGRGQVKLMREVRPSHLRRLPSVTEKGTIRCPACDGEGTHGSEAKYNTWKEKKNSSWFSF